MLSHDYPNDIPGARELAEWFGCWPSFHDAEVLSLSLDRSAPCRITIHTWKMTTEVDSTGHFVCTNDVVVTFEFDDVVNLSLEGFNMQNVIFGLTIHRTAEGYKLAMSPCFGITGEIEGKRLKITFLAGKPPSIRFSE